MQKFPVVLAEIVIRAGRKRGNKPVLFASMRGSFSLKFWYKTLIAMRQQLRKFGGTSLKVHCERFTVLRKNPKVKKNARLLRYSPK